MDTARVAARAADSPDAVVLVLPLALIAAAVLVLVYLRRRGAHPSYRTVPDRWDGRPTAPPAEAQAQAAGPPADELDSRARDLLVRLDDAVFRRREQLDFAGALSGEEAVGPHRAAVADAAAEAGEALRLRLRLDDPAVRRNETERRRLLNDIIDRCTAALRRLESVAGSLAAARGLPADAAEALRAARARAAELPARLDRVAERLRSLAEAYAEPALAPVRDHPAVARERWCAAGGRLDAAERALAAGDLAAAADAVLDAEAALGEAAILADGAERWARSLQRADLALAEAIRVTEGDVAAAPHLPALREDLARAVQALADARLDTGTGRRDPFAGLRRLADGGTRLAQALESGRDRESRNRRARTLLDEALLTAGSELSAVRDYVTTHRSEVGSPARTRLAEAAHRLERALSVAPHDAATALPFAWHADALAREAHVLALRDAGAAA
ncbi:hypothetical protein [Streptomyces johnsoniae]|uniref:Uncharacterized protein n=1 Tax=Streptomyces johnsoniae TaxID=3075532 RepID=A0ABU2S358_9ACTN|nr:hypothetical protein [Streptomyces sp. DSM 41886]MDT0443131.1 hypothetical protein [Streptomyces sp. DSM 41886]